MQEYCKALPKIELHAHLNGSINNSMLKQLCIGKQNLLNDILYWDGIINDEARSLTQCLELFDLIYQITDTPEVIKLITKSVINDFNDDGVIYLELRTTPRHVDGKMTKVEYLEAVISAIKELESLNIKVKLLISLNRRQSQESSSENVDLAIKYKNIYNDLIYGVDVSGDPEHGSWFEELIVRARNAGLRIAMHCAEVPNLQETRDILEFKPDRIGHGTCIHENCRGSKDLWDMLLSSKIPVECCLTSNIKTNTIKNYEDHHFKYLYEAKHPLIVCTDDKGVFSTTLSEEFCLVSKYFNLGYEDLFQISYNSIKHIFTSEKEQQDLEKKFQEWKNVNKQYF